MTEISPGSIQSGLFTDFYELTMVQGYLRYDTNPQVVFDMFFRRQPFGGGFTVYAGLEELIDRILSFRFTEEEIEYLRAQGLFREDFLSQLADFQFQGSIWSVPEGSIVFPGEPLIRIHASLVEAQLIEGLLLNTINFQTLIATKAARVYLASNRGKILEFGLRRAQGFDGAMSAARAAYIGGAAATSNTLAGKRYGIPVRGTMAHSWVMAFPTEEESFERYADLYPDSSILLIDTYSTLESGIDNAIRIGKAMQKRGKRVGVRLDSGDLQYLSKQVRRRLDEAGLTDTTITASNELNEEIIHQLVTTNSPIDSWGVGTQLVTGGDDASLSGVYKLACKIVDGKPQPTMKVSSHPAKTTLPGVKQLYRFRDDAGSPLADLIALADEEITTDRTHLFIHPDLNTRRFEMTHYASIEPMLKAYVTDGKRVVDPTPLPSIRDHCLAALDAFDETYKRIINPHVYKVSLSSNLAKLQRSLVSKFTTQI